ncbi:proline dehydrogenase family protein [Actinomadura livida]|uniref:proline dehydrogenase n=1 Tax=Actinomadura livida TaxID=79909 RepID=A0A7W7N0U0_9ACTN|nr:MULTISPECIES: proline dehydrogenase family protein [Actinomadura]MBB4777260.1 proline dehydrogenase [Actinomadura catellatispora]GGU20461.1 proline dehydrogenase [Actinomadura livida]
MPNPVLLAAARSRRMRDVVTSVPLTKGVVDRFVAGDDLESAVRVVEALVGGGVAVTLDHLGEDTVEVGQARDTRDAYLRLMAVLEEGRLSEGADVSLKLSALGRGLSEGLALDYARDICAAAERVGMTVTLDMEDHTTVDSTLEVLGKLRVDFPWVGVAVQAMLRRSEGDLRDLAGSRVRLVKGAYAEPVSVAFQGRREVDLAYVRGLRTLMGADGYPMIATHDPRIIEIASLLAGERAPGSYEFQMLYGVRVAEQNRLARRHRMRVYVPYGVDWYGYFMRRLAERPANLAFFLRSFVSR